MTQYTRRDALVATGSVSTLAVAGCLSDGGADEPDGANGTQADGTTDNSRVEGVETFQLGGSLSRPEWVQTDDRTGLVSVAESPQDIAWLVDDPERVDGLRAWLLETDFDDAVVLCSQTVGPNTCFTELAVSDVGVTESALENESEPRPAITATIQAIDTSGEREVCGEMITYPAALIRITGDDLPPVATVSITDGWGETSEVDTTSGLLDPAELPGFVQPTHDPQPADVLECPDDEVDRHPSSDDDGVVWGDSDDESGVPQLALRVENPQFDVGGDSGGSVDRGGSDREAESDDDAATLEFERGDEVHVRLWNVSSETVMTGNAAKYNFEQWTDDGWQDVRVGSDDVAFTYTDEGVLHPPGEAFEWTFELTEDGILEGHVHGDRLTVCPELSAGRYRFSYWGTGGRGTIAVGFDLVE